MDETIYVILKVLFDFALEVWLSIYFFFSVMEPECLQNCLLIKDLDLSSNQLLGM